MHTSDNIFEVKSHIELWRSVTKTPFLHERECIRSNSLPKTHSIWRLSQLIAVSNSYKVPECLLFHLEPGRCRLACSCRWVANLWWFEKLMLCSVFLSLVRDFIFLITSLILFGGSWDTMFDKKSWFSKFTISQFTHWRLEFLYENVDLFVDVFFPVLHRADYCTKAFFAISRNLDLGTLKDSLSFLQWMLFKLCSLPPPKKIIPLS